MTAMTRGLGPDSLKERDLNDEGVGMDVALVLMSWRWVMAIPSPVRPSRRGLSMQEYPGGVA